MDQEPRNESPNSEEDLSRRDFLLGAKGWSAVVAGLALAMGVKAEPASAWINVRGPGWINRSGWVNRGWVNARPGWLNAGGGWINRSGWINGGGGWINRGGWVNRGGWINARPGGSWLNRW
jgi:hypothetical protein